MTPSRFAVRVRSAPTGFALNAGDQRVKAWVEQTDNRIFAIVGAELMQWTTHADAVARDWAQRADREGLDGHTLLEHAKDLIGGYRQ